MLLLTSFALFVLGETSGLWLPGPDWVVYTFSALCGLQFGNVAMQWWINRRADRRLIR